METHKQRIIQEYVPGKQVTLAHLIANPEPSLYKKLGVIGEHAGALGIMTITPSEAAIIAADAATKAAGVEVVNETIDTPGEYLEHRAFLRNLMLTAVDTDLVLFLLDATQERFMYSPGQAASFPMQVAGVVTKTDLASETQRRQARELLELAGASPIFEVGSVSGDGIDDLLEFLKDEAERPGAEIAN